MDEPVIRNLRNIMNQDIYFSMKNHPLFMVSPMCHTFRVGYEEMMIFYNRVTPSGLGMTDG